MFRSTISNQRCENITIYTVMVCMLLMFECNFFLKYMKSLANSAHIPPYHREPRMAIQNNNNTSKVYSFSFTWFRKCYYTGRESRKLCECVCCVCCVCGKTVNATFLPINFNPSAKLERQALLKIDFDSGKYAICASITLSTNPKSTKISHTPSPTSSVSLSLPFSVPLFRSIIVVIMFGRYNAQRTYDVQGNKVRFRKTAKYSRAKKTTLNKYNEKCLSLYRHLGSHIAAAR